jgi:hypothetical protein
MMANIQITFQGMKSFFITSVVKKPHEIDYVSFFITSVVKKPHEIDYVSFFITSVVTKPHEIVYVACNLNSQGLDTS